MEITVSTFLRISQELQEVEGDFEHIRKNGEDR